MKYDVVIIGAGVAGLMTAIELAAAGRKVHILERGKVGRESSWAGGGILSPIYPWRYPDAVSQLAQWSIEHYPAYFARLQEQTGIDPEWLSSGHLILQALQETSTIKQWANRFSAVVEVVDQKQLKELEPELDEQFTNAIWMPDIGQVRNPRLVKALRAYAENTGVSISENTAVSTVLHESRQIHGLSSNNGNISADQVLVTAGAWSGQFKLGDNQLNIQPVKGQMIQFQTQPGAIKRITLLKDRYVIPRQDGKVLVGSTLEHCGFEKSTDQQTRQQLHEIAASIYPLLESAPIINHWSGLRPGNERQIPYIGQHPEINGLYFNTGHYRNGIAIGLASARLCADIICGNPPILPPQPYRLE